MAAKGEETSEVSLREMFDKGMALHDRVELSEEPNNSEKLQKTITSALECFIKTTEMVNKLGLFSSNEDLEEVATTDLRYFLLPVFLGDLTLQQMSTERISVVKIAKIYLIDFLKRCKDYEITDKDVFHSAEPTSSPLPGAEGLKQMANVRQEKIRRYKEQKQQESRLKELKNCVEGSHSKPVDEEIQREYYLLLIKIWVNKAVDHLASIKDELEILSHMEDLRKGVVKPEANAAPRKPMKPILLTRESIKAKVFGAGYPSVPTMTQEEYLEKEIKEGKVVLEYDSKSTNPTKSEEEEEVEDDDEDPEKLLKARAMDDWKDDHRRGWGNRENMG